MKKLFLLLMFSLSVFILKAQSKWEIRAGYGLASAPEIIDGLTDISTSVGSMGTVNSSSSLSYGPVIVVVNYYPMHKLSVGLQYANTKLNNVMELSNGGASSNYKNTYNVIMARSDYYYTTGLVQVYSGLGAGVSFAKSTPKNGAVGNDFKSTDFAYQINAIGARVGRTIGAFAELGFGYNGILNLGVSAKF